MPEVTTRQPGQFCWFELATSNQNAAKEFYSKLFDWQSQDIPIGPDMNYTMLSKDGKTVGALFAMQQDQQSAGIPSHWNTYVTVANADEAQKKAQSLGAKVLVPAFDVMDQGRMTTIQDPTGATISLWESKKSIGANLVDEPGAFCWYELNTNDTDAAKIFYTGLLNWSTGGSPEYTEWRSGEKHVGGMMKTQAEWGNVPPSWTNYVMVTDAEAIANKAKSLGGKVLVGPQDIPNTGRFAILQDPQGAVLGVYQPKQGA